MHRLSMAIVCGFVLALMLVLSASAAPARQTVPPNRLTYQGHLMQPNGEPVPDGEYMMTFALYDAPALGNVLWGPEAQLVGVKNGYFAAVIGVGEPIMPEHLASNTYLQVTVSGDTMTPRHQLTSVPFALVAGAVLSGSVSWGDITGIPAGFADGVDDVGTYYAGDGLALDANTFALAAKSGNAYDFSSGSMMAGSASWIGGGAGHVVTSTYSVVAGGYANAARGNHSVVSGGGLNTAAGQRAVVAGGYYNCATGAYAAVSGGYVNAATGQAAVIGGGETNAATARYSTVGGGYDNSALGAYSVVPGGHSGLASNYGQIAAASGSFANPGDAQGTLQIVARRYISAHVHAVNYPLYIDGSSALITVPVGSAYTLDILVVGAAQSAGCAYGSKVVGVVANDGSGADVVAEQSIATAHDCGDHFYYELYVSGAGVTISVRPEGNVNRAIRWVATIRAAEVSFP